MALCGADRSTFHTAHQPQSPSWPPLDQEKEWFGINSAGAQWKEQGYDGQGLVAAAGAGQDLCHCHSRASKAGLSLQGKAPGSFSSPRGWQWQFRHWRGHWHQQSVLRSAGFPLWVCGCIYILVWPVLVFTWGQKLPMGTQILREVSCSLRSAISKFLSKSRWVLWNPHHHHLSFILCMLLHGLAVAITISPDLSYSLTLLQDQRGKFFPHISPHPHYLCQDLRCLAS